MKLWIARVANAMSMAMLIAAATAMAQGSYPVKPIRVIVPWPPGGGGDVLCRMLGPNLTEAFGQQVVIDNRSGAAGNIGAALAAKASADGYTILFAFSGTHAVNPSIYSKMPFKESDFTPIVWLSSVPQLLVVHPSLPVKTVKDLIALAKAKPRQLSYGSSGSGAINHLEAALFAMMTGTDMVHVPYKGGGPLIIALLGGEIPLIFGEPATVLGFIKTGRVRAIAVAGAKRALALPDLPTIAESGVPGYEVTSWNGMLAPAGTPTDIIARLNTEYNRIIAAPDISKRMIENGWEPVGGPPEKFGEFIRAEIAKWAPVIKAAGVKVD